MNEKVDDVCDREKSIWVLCILVRQRGAKNDINDRENNEDIRYDAEDGYAKEGIYVKIVCISERGELCSDDPGVHDND